MLIRALRPLMACLVTATCLALPARAASPKIAFQGLSAGAAVDDQTAGTLSDALAGELRRASLNLVATPKDVAAALTQEQRRQALGCTDDKCHLDFGTALEADELLVGQLSRLGESWILSARRLELTGKSLRAADRRLRGGTIDDVLDALPALVAELYDVPAQPLAKPTAQAPALAPSFAEKPSDPGDLRAKLKVATDGAGHYFTYVPDAGSLGEGFYAGDAQKLFLQRVSGGGRNGADFDMVFWEPRVKARWMASFGVKEGKPFLYCGEKPLALTDLPAAEAKKLVAGAKFFDVRWQRRGYAIARDDNARYFVVDQAREPEGNTDFRVFAGKKGQLAPIPVEDAMVDDEGTVLLLGDRKLRVDARKNEAEWFDHGVKTPLKLLDLESQVMFIYLQSGAYKGESLGTPCDGLL